KKSNIRIVATQSFSFTQESVVNSVPLVRAAAKIYDADLLLLTSNSAGALPLLAQLLPEAGLNPKKIQYAGLARWDIPAQNINLPGLQGGWFAVPETARYEVFSDHYFAEYREKPHPLAGLAFDAISAVGALAQSGYANAVTTKALTRKSGFSGVDGIFRFTAAGTNQRGLAIAQISDSQVNIIDDAPQSFNRSGM
ncbi:MAG: penicillin-binding protein activator, partial [Rhodobacteraceae bacterium]|nr:penicillin-binding protein activator [Paracoccaceae bacterium]